MFNASVNSYVDRHRLELKLRPILVGELYLAKKLFFPAYIFKNGTFAQVLGAGSVPGKEFIGVLLKNGYREVYIFPEDSFQIKKNLEIALIKITRSLSVGDPLQNGIKDIKLLSLNFAGLYKNPHDDELLMVQFQSSQNLSKFLLDQKKHQSSYFHSLLQENFHYTQSQPMLSSILLLSFLQALHLFNEREIENLFLTSYMKDIGLSMIPEDKYDLKTLSSRDEQLLSAHADHSFDILEGRIPLAKSYLSIIKHHHFMNDKMKDLLQKEKSKSYEPDMIFGIESVLVSVFDILVAMTSDRPYRKRLSLYQSLELIRKMMADEYPQEFKALVIFLKQFYKN